MVTGLCMLQEEPKNRVSSYRLPEIPPGSSIVRIARGFDVGDPSFDALSVDVLQTLAKGLSPDVTSGKKHNVESALNQDAELCKQSCSQHAYTLKLPHWADRSSLIRGQGY